MKKLSIPYTNNASLKLRYMAVKKFNEGNSRASIARELDVSRRLVNEWIVAYLSYGFEGLALKKPTGRPSLLNNEEKLALKNYVLSHAVKPQGGRLMGKDIQEYIKETYGVSYQIRNIYRLMKELNIVWITSRSKHPKQAPKAQENFKKNS